MHFEVFCQFLRDPNEYASFCVGFSSGKMSSFKKSPKSQNLGFLKKVFFCLFCTWKFINLISFWYYLEENGLNYQTENKQKFIFSPKIKENQKSSKFENLRGW